MMISREIHALTAASSNTDMMIAIHLRSSTVEHLPGRSERHGVVE